ncbi:MAG: ribonuclease III [Clostridia bacterium]|nr:ribonuclease III [Clostridia bacterium]MBO7150597.1 ribonuclease III [Clostridia bacterium]
MTTKEPLPCDLPAPTALAFLGDAAFGLLVRQALVEKGTSDSGKLHKASLAYVTAAAQARFFRRIKEHLSDYEADLCRRAYNNSHLNKPKKASFEDYRCATALEALFGYLHYTNQSERTAALFALCRIEENEDDSEN